MFDDKLRLSAKEALQHPWLNKFEYDKLDEEVGLEALSSLQAFQVRNILSISFDSKWLKRREIRCVAERDKAEAGSADFHGQPHDDQGAAGRDE